MIFTTYQEQILSHLILKVKNCIAETQATKETPLEYHALVTENGLVFSFHGFLTNADVKALREVTEMDFMIVSVGAKEIGVCFLFEDIFQSELTTLILNQTQQ
jgi:hypothetical protein